MKPIAPNTLIQNRYLIVHLIGKGGMGEVYLAVDQRLGSAIALKRTFFSDDVLLGNAFEREARTLARLRHPVLPKVSDHFTDEGTQYLVMEHISGEDMSKRLEAATKPFPLSWVLFWADQLLDALTYLHTHEPPIIHRDIKPQNLKLTDENHIVLLDFGLSKNSTGETRAATSGGSSIVGYTPHYAPMEQIRGTGTDARSDIYSLSATMYQILTGNIPPDALTRADSLINGLPDPITPISEINTEVSRGVSDVIVKGMAISQERRYKTAREMQKALRDAYAQMQNETTASTVEYSAGSEPAIIQAQQKSEPVISQAQPKTEAVPVVPPVSQTPLNSQPTPTASSLDVASDQHSSIPPSSGNEKSVADFDATLRYDPAQDNSTPKQADIKTEVFLAGSSSAISDAIAGAKQGSYSRGESFSRQETGKSSDLEESRFFSEADLNQSPGYSPDATVQLVSVGNRTGETGSGENAAQFDSFAGAENNHSTVAPTAKAAVVPGKSKSSKSLAVVGGLAALLILAIGAGAVGWYVMRDSAAVVEEATPNPTVEATVTVEPTVEATMEIVNDANTNTDANTDANMTGDNEPTNDNTAPSNTNRPANVKTGGTTTTAPTAAPTRNVQPLPTRPPVVPRPTPLIRIGPSQPTPRPTAKKTPFIPVQ